MEVYFYYFLFFIFFLLPNFLEGTKSFPSDSILSIQLFYFFFFPMFFSSAFCTSNIYISLDIHRYEHYLKEVLKMLLQRISQKIYCYRVHCYSKLKKKVNKNRHLFKDYLTLISKFIYLSAYLCRRLKLRNRFSSLFFE